MFRSYAEGPMKGILAVTDEELVSSDFIGNSYSSIVDLPSTFVGGGKMVKVLSWYDNEWGFLHEDLRPPDLRDEVTVAGEPMKSVERRLRIERARGSLFVLTLTYPWTTRGISPTIRG